MRIFMFVSGVLVGLGGLAVWGSAESAIHEIEAFILFVVAAVLISGAAIVEVLNGINVKLSLLNQDDQEEKTQQELHLT